ncbi:hypothetical protein [Streptomyces sp. NPDC058330]|uniref:hypothetical protein n=1 Tax=Streptomyces sp. NPDC058330 TaxID=3346449 RepID=UPI0036E6B4B1
MKSGTTSRLYPGSWGIKSKHTERSRVAPSIREEITDPVYSFKNVIWSWEHLVRRMESDWQLPRQYPISAYINDLDARDQLPIAMGALTGEVPAELSALLGALDARVVHESVPDEGGPVAQGTHHVPWYFSAEPSVGGDAADV